MLWGWPTLKALFKLSSNKQNSYFLREKEDGVANNENEGTGKENIAYDQSPSKEEVDVSIFHTDSSHFILNIGEQLFSLHPAICNFKELSFAN